MILTQVKSSKNPFEIKIDKSSAVAEMGDRLATIHMGRKEWTGCSSALEYPNGQFLSLA